MDAFAVVADPTRRRLLDHLLLEGSATVGELVVALDATQPNVSKHLRVLREAGWVIDRADGPRRIYSLAASAPGEMESWLAPYRRFWEQRLDAFAAELDRAASTPAPNTRKEPIA